MPRDGATSRPPHSGGVQMPQRRRRLQGGLAAPAPAPAPLCGSTPQMQDEVHVDPRPQGACRAPRSPAGPRVGHIA